MLLPLLIAAVVGYLLGALPFGYLVARAHGMDIFKVGSGNPGATNVKRVLGAKAGNMVFALDALKGLAAAGWPLLITFTPEAGQKGLPEWLQITGLLGAVLGHSFSVFTRFKGGKGVATTTGGLLVLMPVPTLIGVVGWFTTFLATRYVSLASILSVVVGSAAAWVLGLSLPLKIVVTVLGVLVIVRHHSNIRRLLTGTEHRWERGQDKKTS
jgi:glycerol-3-phosphate acyltransferase PlsY